MRELNIQFSFRMKLIASLSAVILVILCLGGYISYRIHLHLFEGEISRQFHKANEQSLARLELQIENIYRTSNYIVFHPYVEEIIQRSSNIKYRDSFEQYLDRVAMRELLDKVRLDAPKLNALYLYDLNGNPVYYHSNMSIDGLKTEDYQSIEASLQGSNGGTVWESRALTSSLEPGGYRNVIVASRLMKSVEMGTYGTLVMIFDHTLLSGLLEELTSGQQGKVYLFNPQSQLLYTDDATGSLDPMSLLDIQETDIQPVDDAPYLFSRNDAEKISFTLVSRVSLENIRSKSQNIYKISLFSAIISICLAWVLVMLTSQKLLHPLKELVQGMRRLREGNFDTRIEVRTRDELGFIGQSFNSMAANIHSLIKEVYEVRLSEREAELKALQAQLNPHFLYNTLDTIYWSAYLKDDMETSDLVVSLSQMLRYSLEPVNQMTVLKEEMRQTENYLHIQKARFKDDLKTSILVDEDVQNCLLIRFIMQPLVENIFVHAFRNKQFDRVIDIKAHRSGDKLMIVIADNGCGMDQETVRRLLSPPVHGDQGARISIGIQSVIRRIALIYGEDYGLEIESEPQSGTAMKLILPYQLQRDSQEGEIPG